MASETPSEVLGQFYVRGIDGSSWPGILTFGPQASLRLLIVSPEIGDPVPAPLATALDGKQVDFVGESNARGCVTLLRCAHTNQRSSNQYFRGVKTTELTFQPTEIWTGPRPFERDDSFTQLVLGFFGIHGIIGTKPLVRKFVTPEERGAIEGVLGDTFDVFYSDRSAKHHTIALDEPSADVSFGSGYSTSHSWTEGDAISTYDECLVRSREALAGEALISIGAKIERFLSFICLKTIRCSSFKLKRSRGENAPAEQFERLWYLGADDASKSVMFHQALASCFKEASAIDVALRRWLSPSADETLARWLYLDSQDESVISTGRFMSVCQAIEIIGRQAKGAAPYDKAKFKSAAHKAADVICAELGPDFDTEEYRNRFRQLVAIGNRFSFRDHIHAFVSAIPLVLRKAFLPDQDAFIARLVKMRNLFVHMESQDLAFEQAESHIGEMTYRLLALFAAHQGAALGLNPDRVLSGLANSSIGRAAITILVGRRVENEPHDRKWLIETRLPISLYPTTELTATVSLPATERCEAMSRVWVVWDGAPRVFSSPQAATEHRNEYPQSGQEEIFEADVDSLRLGVFQEWELEAEKTYRAIGRFMYEFSQAEYALRHAVGEELGFKDEYFSAVVSTFDVGVLCNLAVSVFADKSNDRSEEIKAPVNRFRALNNHRQRVAHGLWVPSLEGGLVHYTARSSLKGSSHKQQAEALDKLADEALSLRNGLSEELTGVGIYFHDEGDDHRVT